MPFTHSAVPLYEIKAGLFKGLSHPVRIRVLELVVESGECSVTHLLEQTGLEASHLSQHLAVLRRHRLVVSERRASHVFYRLAYAEVVELLTAARHLLTRIATQDRTRFTELTALPPLPG